MKFTLAIIAATVTAVFNFMDHKNEVCQSTTTQCVAKESVEGDSCFITETLQNETKLITIPNKKCKEGEVCRHTNETIYSCKSFVVPKKYSNVSCNSSDDCGGISCSSEGKCVAKNNGEECKGDSECLPGSFCNTTTTPSVCAILKDEGDECTDDIQCGYFLFCNKHTHNEKGVCVKKYSLKVGEPTLEEDFCETGFAIGDGEKKICAGVTYMNENDTCSEESKCTVTVEYGQTNATRELPCLCDFDGNSYCSNWPKQIEIKKKIIKTGLINYKSGRVHVSHYRKNLWGFSDIFDEIDKGHFVHTEECALQGLIGYKLAGGYLKIGLLILSFFFLI